MFERIREHVNSFLTAQGEPGMDPGKVIYLNHSEGITEGALQLIFGQRSDYPLLVAKGAPEDRDRYREGRSIYEIEYENLVTLERIGMNEGTATTPRPLGLWREDGLIITLQTALPGELLKNIPAPSLFSEQTMRASLDHVMAWWERLQKAYGVHRQIIDDAFYQAEVLDALDAFQQHYTMTPSEREFLDRRLRDERSLANLELPMFVRHGDLCTANMVQLENGIGVFDWEFPFRHELPMFDIFHFFASLRYPFTGPRGESTHFDSFVTVYWQSHPLGCEMRRRIAAVCDSHDIPTEALGDLFLMSLIQIANLKYEGFVEKFGATLAEPPLDGSASVRSFPWNRIGGDDKNAPFAHIVAGGCETTRYVAEHGLPDFTKK